MRHRYFGRHRSLRWYNRYGYFARSAVVVWPQTFYVDRYIEPVYTAEPVVQEAVVEPAPADYLPEDNAVTLLPPPEPQRSQAELLAPLQAGDAAFQAGDYAQARWHYVNAQLERVYAGEATLAYALTYFAEGDYRMAALALRRGLAELPDAIGNPIDIVLFYGQDEEFEQHLQALNTYLAEQPGDFWAWFALGYVRFGSGDPGGAVEAFDRALEVSSGDTLSVLVREAALAVSDASPAAPNMQGPTGPPPPPPAPDMYRMPPDTPI